MRRTRLTAVAATAALALSATAVLADDPTQATQAVTITVEGLPIEIQVADTELGWTLQSGQSWPDFVYFDDDGLEVSFRSLALPVEITTTMTVTSGDAAGLGDLVLYVDSGRTADSTIPNDDPGGGDSRTGWFAEVTSETSAPVTQKTFRNLPAEFDSITGGDPVSLVLNWALYAVGDEKAPVVTETFELVVTAVHTIAEITG